MKRLVTSLAMIATIATLLTVSGGTARAATCMVPSFFPPYPTIQSAVNDPTCTTINVAPGFYNENVTIPRILTLNGAQANQPVALRVFGGVGESTVNGLITINAPNVILNGFSLTNAAPGQNNGVLVKTAGDAAVIAYNLISFVGSLTLSSNAQGIYLENGPDNVTIFNNDISKIASIPSAKGIYIGDSTATNPSVNTTIVENTISEVQSLSRGAYAIQVNNRAGQPDLLILNNTIRDLTGGVWAHAIGLEGDTPRVIVRSNTITNVLASTADKLAVWFEDNPSFDTGHVNQNNFNVTIADYGIAVQQTLPGGPVDGTCNWWGDPNGPGPVGPGAGALVTPKVDFEPWLTAPASGGSCVGLIPSTPGKVTGGGQVPGDDPLFSPLGDLLSLPALTISSANSNGKATFGFSVRCCPETGNLEYNDHDAGVRIKALSITQLIITGPATTSCPTVPGSQHARIRGTANVIGSTGSNEEEFLVDVDDCGEPGTMDTFGIKTDSYDNYPPKTLIGGNIQIH